MQLKGQGISLSRDIDVLSLFHVDIYIYMSERGRELARLWKQRQKNSTNADIRREEARKHNKLQELVRPIKGGIKL